MNKLIERIRRILIRLEAEVVEQPNIDDLHLVIVEKKPEDEKNIERKRKNDSPIVYQPKRSRMNSVINNNNSTVTNKPCSFLELVTKRKIKMRTVIEVWQWLCKYYNSLVQDDEYDDSFNFNTKMDKINKLKVLELPALKILDLYGRSRPQILQNCHIDENFLFEYNVNNSLATGLRRLSTGTSKLMKNTPTNFNGYCECCKENYQDLYQHIESDGHKSFADRNSNFAEIDKLISNYPKIPEFLNQSIKQKLSRLSIRKLSQVSEKFSAKGTNKIDSEKTKTDNVSVCDKNIVEEASSSTDSCASSSSSSSASTSSSDSEPSKSSTRSHGDCPVINENNCVSSTPLHKRCKAHFILDSVSADETEQRQISQHVSEIIENLNSQLADKDNRDSSIDRSIALSGLDRQSPIDNFNLNERIGEKFTIQMKKSSPILTRRFDWCKNCKINHVPIGVLDFSCPFTDILNRSVDERSSGLSPSCQKNIDKNSLVVDIDKDENRLENKNNPYLSNDEFVLKKCHVSVDRLKIDSSFNQEKQNEPAKRNDHILELAYIENYDNNEINNNIKINNNNCKNKLVIDQIIDLTPKKLIQSADTFSTTQQQPMGNSLEISKFIQLNIDCEDDDENVEKEINVKINNSRIESIENIENQFDIKKSISNRSNTDRKIAKSNLSRRKLLSIENNQSASNKNNNKIEIPSAKRQAAIKANHRITITSGIINSSFVKNVKLMQAVASNQGYDPLMRICQMSVSEDFLKKSKKIICKNDSE